MIGQAVDEAEVGDAPFQPQVERAGHVVVDRARRPAALHLRGVAVETQHARIGRRVCRAGVLAEEERDLVVFERRLHLPEVVVVRRILLITVADVGGADVPVLVIVVLPPAEPFDKRTRAQIAIALIARLVRAVAEERAAEAEVDFSARQRRQPGVLSRLRGRGVLLPGARLSREQPQREDDEIDVIVRMSLPLQRNSVLPAGLLDPWICEWQLTQPRPIRRLLFDASAFPS